MKTKIREIEQQFPVELLEYKGQKVWPYLRVYIDTLLIGGSDASKLTPSIFKNFIQSFFYGFFSWFKKTNYIYVTDTSHRKKINNKYVDVIADPIADFLKDGLFLEFPIPSHFSKSKIPTESIISRHFFHFFIFLYMKLLVRKMKISHEDVLKRILADCDVSIDYEYIIKRVWAQYKVTKIFLKLKKPKVVFINCSYTNMGMIKATKENKIKVVEMQHGIINHLHNSYVVSKNVDDSFYPDFLLTFGNQEIDVFNDSNYFIERKNVRPIGHYYIDHLFENGFKYPQFEVLRHSFRKTVAISSQNHYIEKSLIDFVRELALLDSSILYVFIPRIKLEKKATYVFPSNVVILEDLDCYQIISLCDVHSTVFSTCAIEALSLGKQNIMINLEGLSKKIFGDILNDPDITTYVDTPVEYLNVLNNLKNIDCDTIRHSNMQVIIPNYKNNLIKELTSILRC